MRKHLKANFSCRKTLLYVSLYVGIFFCGSFCSAILLVSFTSSFNFVPLFDSQFLCLSMFISFLFYITFFVVRSILEGNMSFAWYVILSYIFPSRAFRYLGNTLPMSAPPCVIPLNTVRGIPCVKATSCMERPGGSVG